MGRSGYTEGFGEDDPLAMGRYRQAVHMAMQGKRGQAFLRELLATMDAMEEKRLVAHSFVAGPVCCAAGLVAVARGIDLSEFELPEDYDEYAEVDAAGVANALGIAESMVREIMYTNDDYFQRDEQGVEEARFQYVRAWVVRQLEGKDY